MKHLLTLAFVTALAACTQEPPVEPTDGPCGPGSWTVTQGARGPVCTPNF